MAGRSAQVPTVNSRSVGVAYILLGAFLLIYPWIASPFWTVQIGAQALILGVIALSVTLLAGYGGMVSLAQLSVAGCAGYMVAIWGFNDQKMGQGQPVIERLPDAPSGVTGVELADQVYGEGAGSGRCARCRCGASRNKLFCDGSRRDVEFDVPEQALIGVAAATKRSEFPCPRRAAGR